MRSVDELAQRSRPSGATTQTASAAWRTSADSFASPSRWARSWSSSAFSLTVSIWRATTAVVTAAAPRARSQGAVLRLAQHSATSTTYAAKAARYGSGCSAGLANNAADRTGAPGASRGRSSDSAAASSATFETIQRVSAIPPVS